MEEPNMSRIASLTLLALVVSACEGAKEHRRQTEAGRPDGADFQIPAEANAEHGTVTQSAGTSATSASDAAVASSTVPVAQAASPSPSPTPAPRPRTQLKWDGQSFVGTAVFALTPTE